MKSLSLLVVASTLFASALADLNKAPLSSRQLLQSGALQSPAPALAGKGAPHGTASSEAVSKLCDDLQEKLGGKVVRLQTTLVDTAYFQSVDHAYNAEQRAYSKSSLSVVEASSRLRSTRRADVQCPRNASLARRRHLCGRQGSRRRLWRARRRPQPQLRLELVARRLHRLWPVV